MADLSETIGSILNDPSAMEQIKALGGMLGIGGDDQSSQPSKPESPGLSAIDPGMMGLMMKLMPLMGRLREDDDSTRLLYALRPFLSEKRQSRVDGAVRLLSIIRVLPLLKESGLSLF